MPDPFRKIQLGDPWPRSVTAYNGMVDAARAERDRRLGFTSGATTTPRNAAIISVLNASGGDLDGNSVLGLDGPIFTPTESEPAFLNLPGFQGITPALPDHWGRFCVLLEPAKTDTVVRAYLAGVCQVMVDVQDVDDEFADVADGESGHLKSAGDGAAQILWGESEDTYSGYSTGLQWALVRIGNRGGRCVARTTSTVTKRSGTTCGSGTADLYQISSAGVLTTLSKGVTLRNMSVEKSVNSGAFVQYKRADGQFLVDWADCGDLSS